MKPAEQIDQQIAELNDWRAQVFIQLRQLIRETDPEITEEWKWNTGVWSHNGPVCAIGAFKKAIKLNFFQGASLDDPHKLFNAGLDAKKTRAIDFHEGDTINQTTLQELIKSAVAYNMRNQ